LRHTDRVRWGVARDLAIATAGISLALLGALVAGGTAEGPSGWSAAAPMPTPRSEVAAATLDGRVVVVGGYRASGGTTKRVEAYDPVGDSWDRLPDLPVAVNHAMAASLRGRLYVAGGYRSNQEPTRKAFVFTGGRWKALPPMPGPRAAGGAAALRGRLYVVAGVADHGRVGGRTFAFNPDTRRWSTVPAPTNRQHLAVAAADGRIYALAGRIRGFGSNMDIMESYNPKTERWRAEPPVPDPRGGTGAAVTEGTLVSVGGEEHEGTIAGVYGFDLEAREWSELPSLPQGRHGLGVVAVGDTIYAIGGGPQPGLTVSGDNESLDLSP
jgi:N-acetylneuraminic acid mutarotase